MGSPRATSGSRSRSRTRAARRSARASATVTITDAVPPDTIITAGPAHGATVDAVPRFEFAAVTPIPWYFECRSAWDGARPDSFRRCSSPHSIEPPAAPGRHQLVFEVRAVDFRGNPDPTPALRSITYFQPRIDLTLEGMEITQGVQRRDCVSSDGCRLGIMSPDYVARALGRNPARRYQGLTLAGQCQGVDARGNPCPPAKQVVVRVYVTYRGDPALAQGAFVRVFGFDSNGRPLGHQLLSRMPGDPRPPEPPPRLRPCCAALTVADRKDPGAAYTFVLPGDWSRHRSLRLRAVVSPSRPDIVDTQPVDNELEVFDIFFARPTTIMVKPAWLKVRGVEKEGTPDAAFAGARAAFPTPIDTPDYMAVIDANAAAEEPHEDEGDEVWPLLKKWADEQKFASGVYPYGLYSPGRGMTSAATKGGTRLYRDRPLSYAPASGWPLTKVAHELGHGLNLPHAGLECGGNSDGQVGSAWPPDHEGRTAGFGLDTSTPWPYEIRGDDAATPFWDLMSYCGTSEGDHWLSPQLGPPAELLRTG